MMTHGAAEQAVAADGAPSLVPRHGTPRQNGQPLGGLRCAGRTGGALAIVSLRRDSGRIEQVLP